MNVKIFDTPDALGRALAVEFQEVLSQKKEKNQSLFVALSGGSTPKKFFEALAQLAQISPISWDAVHFFWGDERCVPPEDVESNFGMAKKILLDKIPIPSENIHRIRGEAEPEKERLRYQELIEKLLPKTLEGVPRFDWIFLGLGEDGHTASLFPNSEILRLKNSLVAVAKHPVSGQKRITLTLPVITKAAKITFLVTGKKKARLVQKIIERHPDTNSLPAALVNESAHSVEWYLDRDAGSYLKI